MVGMQPLQTVQTALTVETPQAPRARSVFMTAQEAADVLDVSRRHVVRAVQEGRIPGFKFGDTYRVFRAFVQKVVAEMEAGRFVDFDDFAANQMTQVSEVVVS